MKRPAFQFYPADWAKDLGLRSCSLAARGLWMEMLCMAHESSHYGYLELNGVPLSDLQIVNGIAGATRKMLRELERSGVFSRDDSGTIFSRRMVRDEQLRAMRANFGNLGAEHGIKGAEHGKKGGRPHKDARLNNPPSDGNPTVDMGGFETGVKPPPSSASSSSSKSAVGVTPTDSARATPPNGQNGTVENTANSTAKVNSERQEWRNPAWVTATATTLGIHRLPHETDDAWTDRVISTVNAKRVSDAAKSERRRAHS